jgi:hypothetical protein
MDQLGIDLIEISGGNYEKPTVQGIGKELSSSITLPKSSKPSKFQLQLLVVLVRLTVCPKPLKIMKLI